ncbi:Thioredoxin domain-containing protein 3, partial [Galemys pyrenaicus]
CRPLTAKAPAASEREGRALRRAKRASAGSRSEMHPDPEGPSDPIRSPPKPPRFHTLPFPLGALRLDPLQGQPPAGPTGSPDKNADDASPLGPEATGVPTGVTFTPGSQRPAEEPRGPARLRAVRAAQVRPADVGGRVTPPNASPWPRPPSAPLQPDSLEIRTRMEANVLVSVKSLGGRETAKRVYSDRNCVQDYLADSTQHSTTNEPAPRPSIGIEEERAVAARSALGGSPGSLTASSLSSCSRRQLPSLATRPLAQLFRSASGQKALQEWRAVINNQSLWDEMLQNKGLTVIDVYQAWCGPCKAMQTLFRKLKNELNEDEILHFAVAEVDNIVTLQPFKDKCEPVFLFSLNGKIVSKIKGANAPLVNKKVISLITEERKILAGEMGRPQDVYQFAIIKPDAVITGKAMEIREKIINAGFVIEAEDKIFLTEEQVRDFYSSRADEPDFEDFVSFMTKALSYIIVVSQGKMLLPQKETEMHYDKFFEDQQEFEVEPKPDMRKIKRDSLQEYLERKHLSHFCDIEENIDNVSKFIDIFFPDFKTMKGLKLEKILALIRPDLLKERKVLYSKTYITFLEDVLNIIEENGFKIQLQRQLVLSEDEAKTLCKEYESKNYFGNIIENMTSGPSLALVLLRDNGLHHWKELVGPTTVEEAIDYDPILSAQFAMESLPISQLYGSDSLETAEREIQYFFPPQTTFVLIKPHVPAEEKHAIIKRIKEDGFDIIQAKEIVLTEEQVGKIYSKITGKDFYKDLLEMFSEGPSLVMILVKWNAISEWRRLMGPTDPEEAKFLSPDSIRAQYGVNVLKNAVHGSSSNYDVMEAIHTVFQVFENPEEN